MLRNLGYDGVYHDQNISVGVLLENPLDYGLESTMLVFSVSIKDKRNRRENLNIEDFSFYMMDEQNYIYNMQKITGFHLKAKITETADVSIQKPAVALIFVGFKPEFLYENLRIAFYSVLEHSFHIIELKH